MFFILTFRGPLKLRWRLWTVCESERGTFDGVVYEWELSGTGEMYNEDTDNQKSRKTTNLAAKISEEVINENTLGIFS